MAAQGRYAEADEILGDVACGTGSWPSLALSARASLRRQVGAYAEARDLDSRALVVADDSPSRADATIGLAADAVAVGALEDARRHHVRAERDAHSDRRTQTRWHWVGAEVSLLAGHAVDAREHAQAALALAPEVSLRHTLKSQLILAAATGEPESLPASQRLIQSEGWPTLAWPLALIAGECAQLCEPAWLTEAWTSGREATYTIEAGLPPELIGPWRDHPGVRRLRGGKAPAGGG